MSSDLWGRRDPLENIPDEAPVTGPCTCDHGWRQVKPRYAEHVVAAVDDSQRAAAYAAVLNSYYPCQRCRPTQFYRWAEGHWEQGHDLTSCATCIDILGGKRAVRNLSRTLHPEENPKR